MDKMTDTSSATLTIGDKTITLPIIKGTIGPDVIDVRKLYADTDVFTFDPGFTSTASCESEITYHRRRQGHPAAPRLSDRAAGQGLELPGGLLPAAERRAAERGRVRRVRTTTSRYHTMLHDQFDRFFQGFRRDAHPMAIMTGAVGALSAFYHDSLDVDDPEQRKISAIRLIAKMPTIAARAFKYSVGQPFVSPRNELGYAENFLRMCFAVPAEPFKSNPILTRAMDRIFILHADHEQNASTSTVRLAGSSGANPFACIAAGIAASGDPRTAGPTKKR